MNTPSGSISNNVTVSSGSKSCKRLITEVVPESPNKTLTSGTDVGTSTTELLNCINTMLDSKLEKLATKSDLTAMCAEIVNLRLEVRSLADENAALKTEVCRLREEKGKDHAELMRLTDYVKRKNLVFRGLDTLKDPLQSIKEVCENHLGINHIDLVSTRTLYEHNGKICVVAELSSEKSVSEILKNTRKLAGTSISIGRDLNNDRLQNKKVMLQLRQDIWENSKKHRIMIKDDKLKIADKWFTWVDKKLVCNKRDGKNVLASLYDEDALLVNLEYDELLAKTFAKN